MENWLAEDGRTAAETCDSPGIVRYWCLNEHLYRLSHCSTKLIQSWVSDQNLISCMASGGYRTLKKIENLVVNTGVRFEVHIGYEAVIRHIEKFKYPGVCI